MDKENYLRLVEENQGLRKTIEALQLQLKATRREMLQERLWRIQFQVDYLISLQRQTKEELEELSKENGSQAENPLQGQG